MSDSEALIKVMIRHNARYSYKDTARIAKKISDVMEGDSAFLCVEAMLMLIDLFATEACDGDCEEGERFIEILLENIRRKRNSEDLLS